MTKRIVFPEIAPRIVFEGDCLAFPALVNETPVECLVTGELLMHRFGATDFTEAAFRESFAWRRSEIQEIARQHIENGWVDEEHRILLTTRFTQLNVTFGDHSGEAAASRALIDAAHRMLTDIIGPNAETVDVEWSGSDGPAGQPGINLRISDPSTPYSIKAFLTPKQWEDPTTLGLFLARLWSSILRARSRKLTLLSG